MRRRLVNVPTTLLAKREAVALMLKLNREDDRPANSVDVDAARPLKDVVDDILAQSDFLTNSFFGELTELNVIYQ